MIDDKKPKPTQAELKRNIYQRYCALRSAFRNPKVAPAPVIDGCQTQTTLAALNYPQYKITPMSRMSLAKYADLVLAGTEYQIPDGEKNAGQSGWAYLDWLRRQVFKKGVRSSGYRTKAAHAARFKEHKEVNTDKLRQTEQHTLAISKAYVQLFRDIRAFANNPQLNDVSRQRLFNILNNADRLYSELFSSTNMREDNAKVLPDEKT